MAEGERLPARSVLLRDVLTRPTAGGFVSVRHQHPVPWRHGRSIGRTLYDANDVLIGLVDTHELAVWIVLAVNASVEPSE